MPALTQDVKLSNPSTSPVASPNWRGNCGASTVGTLNARPLSSPMPHSPPPPILAWTRRSSGGASDRPRSPLWQTERGSGQHYKLAATKGLWKTLGERSLKNQRTSPRVKFLRAPPRRVSEGSWDTLSRTAQRVASGTSRRTPANRTHITRRRRRAPTCWAGGRTGGGPPKVDGWRPAQLT